MRQLYRIAAGAAFALAILLGSGPLKASAFVPLYSFCAELEGAICNDGTTPRSRLVQIGSDFYGTTGSGGIGGPPASGTVFRITAAGDFKVIHNFCQESFCADGGTPGKYLTRGPDGNLYGTTIEGGGHANAGILFKLTSSGEFTKIFTFCTGADCLDGYQPVAVTFDKIGNLFGTTITGGKYRQGTAFEITTANKYVKIHDFCSLRDCADGVEPGALFLASDGDLYGTTAAGGKYQGGTVFKITQAGKLTTLHNFCALKACADGQRPSQAIVEGHDGKFYGTTLQGGPNSRGTIFQVSAGGGLKVLHAFCGVIYCSDGSTPLDGLTVAADGSLYGTAQGGGSFYYGVLFNITTAGQYRNVYDFCARHGCFDGSGPAAPPVLGEDGNLYGTASGGGDKNNVGTVYKFTP